MLTLPPSQIRIDLEPNTVPAWQKALPLLVLLPTALVTNGSLISLAIVVATPRLREAGARANARAPGRPLDAQCRHRHIWRPALVVPVRPGVGTDAQAVVRPDRARQFERRARKPAQLFGADGDRLHLWRDHRRSGVPRFRHRMGRACSVAIGDPLVLLSSAVFGSAHYYQGLSERSSTGLIGSDLRCCMRHGKKLLARAGSHDARRDRRHADLPRHQQLSGA